MKEKYKKGINSSLEHHKRVGKKLIAPFNQIPQIMKVSWANQTLPEMLWTVLIMSIVERKEAIFLVKKFINTITKRYKMKDATISSFIDIPDNIFDSGICGLLSNRQVKRALRPLMLFKELPGIERWEKYLAKPRKQIDFMFLDKAIFLAHHHQTDIATDSRWVRVYSLMRSGKLLFNYKTDTLIDEISCYEKYCEDGKVKASMRALEGGFNCHNNINERWVDYFWKHAFNSNGCIIIERKSEQYDLSNSEGIAEQTYHIYEEICTHFIKTIETTDIDSRHDSIFGIAIYSIMIIFELAYSSMFTGLIGRFAVRVLTECLILLGYLIKCDKKELWDEYRAYGNGQAKLQLLKVDDDKYTFMLKEHLKLLANEDYWQEFLDIDTGKLLNIDIRKMAIHCGMKDIYDRYYNITSTYVHAQWCAVKYSTMVNCYSSLHRYHRIPSPRLRIHEDVSFISCDLCNRILNLLSEVYPSLQLRYSS